MLSGARLFFAENTGPVAGVSGERTSSSMGKFSAPDENIRRAKHGDSRHMTH